MLFFQSHYKTASEISYFYDYKKQLVDNSQLAKTYKLFSHEGDIIIYGKEFVEKMHAFLSTLNEIDEKNAGYLKSLPEESNTVIRHLQIGYTDKYLKILKIHTLTNDIIDQITQAYREQFPEYPIYFE